MAASQQDEKKEGDEGIAEVGHRRYVGGQWDVIGRLQFDFLVAQGLQPSHCLLDIACGSLRGGVHFIKYLDPGNYLGIEKEPTLVALGIEQELGRDVFESKRPEFVISDRFAFHEFTRQPRFSLAQSLFTHLIVEDILTCLNNLRRFVEPGHVLYATFNAGDTGTNITRSHARASFHYPSGEMAGFGERCGWKPTFIGDWNHPRNQQMMRYEAA